VRLLPRILPEEEEEDRRLDRPEPPAALEPEPQTRPLHWGWTVAIAVALSVGRMVGTLMGKHLLSSSSAAYCLG